MPFKRFAKPLSQIFGGAARNTADAADRTNPAESAESAASAADIGPVPPDRLTAARAAAIGGLEDVEALRRLAGLSADAASPGAVERLAQERLAHLVDSGAVDFSELCAPDQTARLVIKGGSSRLRQQAAQRISDPVELKELLRQLRGKDKSVYKIVKQKCDALRAEEQRLVQIQHDVVAACESLERHSHRIYDVIYEPTFRHFLARWEGLEHEAPTEIRERAARAIGRCREIIATHIKELERQAEDHAAEAARQAAHEQAAALAEVESLQRREAAELAAAETAARREAEAKLRADQTAAEAQAVRQIGGLIGKAQGALRDGNTARAAGLRRAVEDRLSTMPGAPPQLTKQVLKLDAALNELKEWKEHAAAPKRAELIEEMETLIGSAEEPQALSERIKQLQDDWKTVSKGIVIDSEADWQRFRQASLAAYQPCREYFEARAKLWEANLEKRRGVMDRVRAFEAAQSGEHPDWRSVAVVLREAPQEWRRHSPVERASGRALQREFDAAMSRLEQRLDAWHASNATEKESLIRLARELGAKQDSRETVDAAKRLQLRWKDVGPARRDQEQSLWAQFRAQCDVIFQKRQQAHADHAASLEAGKARAAALCEEIEQAAGLEGAEVLEGSKKIGEWRSAFESLGELPRADRRSLTDRFERALRRVESAVSQWCQRDKERSIADFFEAGRRIHAYGWAAAHGPASEDCEALKRTAEDSVARVRQWPKGGAEALKVALAKAGGGPGGLDAAAHEKALRLLCIRREILADRETPPEDIELRRGYQMERLVQRMGQGGETRPDEADGLALAWVRVGPVPAQTHEALLERFLRAALDAPR